MDENISRPVSDAEWYCRRDPEEERFYALFFRMCRKYDVHWTSATSKERAFIEEGDPGHLRAGQGTAPWHPFV